jgi:hypothetical protein
MSFDANAHRTASLENWEEAAPGWVRRQELLRELAAPVSQWMLDAVAHGPASAYSSWRRALARRRCGRPSSSRRWAA